jgi:hypothetical protein
MSKLKWKSKTIPIKDLVEWSQNPRKISKADLEDLKQSFLEFGHARTLSVSPEGGKYIIIGGNQSKKALTELNFKTVECSVASRPLTEPEKQKLSILLNHRRKGEGEWDYDVLNSWDIDQEALGIDKEMKLMNKGFAFDNGEFVEEKKPYPVTIIVSAEDYSEWEKIKGKIKSKNDREAFFKILKKLNLSDPDKTTPGK